MCQFSSLMAAAEGPVAEFSSFANLEEKKRKSNLLMSFPKTGNQMGSFGQIRKNSFFPFCRPILDIFGLTLLKDKSENENTRKSTEYWKNVFKNSRRMKATANQRFHFATRRRRKPEFITFAEGPTKRNREDLAWKPD